MDVDANGLLLAKIVVSGIVNVSGMWALCWYEINRKWNKDELSAKGLATVPMYVSRYRVALVIAGVLIPDWLETLPKLFIPGG